MESLDGKGPITMELVARRWLVPGILELRLGRPADFTFLPGQFLRFVMDGYQRDYTMVSAPDAETLDFCIAMVEDGRFSGDILKADIQDSVQLSGPHGYFIFQGPANPAVFVATGTGVAPFVAFCRCGMGAALLLHGVATPGRLIYQDLLQSACRGYVPCISQPSENDDGLKNAFPGRVTHYLEQQLTPGTYDFYLCGRGAMIRDVTALIDQQFSDSRLFIETYD
ncbi:ferredoxin--NADP reductase [Desulfosarcina sp.]|uniref:ferredoxin--NADP reductase n=1 Tax=Desulfosarcina sp. TaxID=2027861 RepID=UPI0029B8DAB4|nr:FAD-binding oxidoreductase [Desulfosarcina sp.]MDX2455271.1 FAD-binding oxidoreductase [Desulfosarcina sp.]